MPYTCSYKLLLLLQPCLLSYIQVLSLASSSWNRLWIHDFFHLYPYAHKSPNSSRAVQEMSTILIYLKLYCIVLLISLYSSARVINTPFNNGLLKKTVYGVQKCHCVVYGRYGLNSPNQFSPGYHDLGDCGFCDEEEVWIHHRLSHQYRIPWRSLLVDRFLSV